MLKESLKIIIREFHDAVLPQFVVRHTVLPRSIFASPLNKVITVTGPRRAGKTTFLLQLVKELVADGAAITDVLYINFEDERILPLTADGLHLILDAYRELYGHAKPPFIFFDEVQNVPGWETFVRRLNEQRYRVTITGSNSRMLGGELATALRGRTLPVEIFPFSFAEYLSSKGIALSAHTVYQKTRHPIQQHLKTYLVSGGYPEIALTEDTRLQTRIMQTYFDAVFYRDLVDRYKIRNSAMLREWLNGLVANIASMISLSKIENDFKSRGLRVSKATLSTFARYVEDVYFGFFVEMHSNSVRKRQVNPKKFYLVDQGLYSHLSVRSSESSGRLLENLVFMQLRRAGKTAYYYRTQSGLEVDFYLKDGNGERLIQVCADTRRIETFDREKRALLAAVGELNLNSGLILTVDEKKMLKTKGVEIQILPVWEWLAKQPTLDLAQ